MVALYSTLKMRATKGCLMKFLIVKLPFPELNPAGVGALIEIIASS
jgi:hypothetical protein